MPIRLALRLVSALVVLWPTAGGAAESGFANLDLAFERLSTAAHSLTVYLALGGFLIVIIMITRPQIRRDYAYMESVFVRSIFFILALGLAAGVVLLAAILAAHFRNPDSEYASWPSGLFAGLLALAPLVIVIELVRAARLRMASVSGAPWWWRLLVSIGVGGGGAALLYVFGVVADIALVSAALAGFVYLLVSLRFGAD